MMAGLPVSGFCDRFLRRPSKATGRALETVWAGGRDLVLIARAAASSAGYFNDIFGVAERNLRGHHRSHRQLG